jgi:MFS family permease
MVSTRRNLAEPGKASKPSVAQASSPRTLAAAFIAAVLSVMPAFLLGGVAVLVRADLGFSESRLGLCVTAYYVASMVAAVPGGHLAERLGGLRACTVGIVLSAGALLSVAALAHGWWQLVACLAVGGMANALLQPATNLALARRIPTHRQGLAFGFKLANGPAATLLAGLSASLIATTVGWRWAFVAMACLAMAFLAVRPPDWRAETPYVPKASDGPNAALPTLVLMAAGSAFAVAAASSLVSFYVESAVAAGLTVAIAGWLQVAGSTMGTVARPAWGWLVDHRRTSGFGLIGLLLTVGGVAFALLGANAGSALLLVATVLAFIAGWGWPGLLLFAVVRASPATPGKATGIVIVGTSTGGVVGPTAFGFLVENAGYAVAWRAAALALLLGAICVGGGARLLRRRITATRAFALTP